MGTYILLISEAKELSFFKKTSENIRTVLDRDPAARNGFEVLICYPGVWALIFHAPSHWCYNHRLKLIGRMISQLARWFTGIEIHPGAKIGRRCFIDHGMGVVIGETSEIGDDVTIYQGVTLGGTGKDTGKRHPTIGDRVTISTGAKVLGPFKVGNDVKIGAGSVVLKEAPNNCTVVGIPGVIVKKDGQVQDLNQIDMPDPIANEIQILKEQITALEDKLKKMEKDTNENI
jgi:serine O-acetyltransferase